MWPELWTHLYIIGSKRNISWVAYQQQINLWVCQGIFLRVINDLIWLELLTPSQSNIKREQSIDSSEHFALETTLNRCQRVKWKHHLFQLPNDKAILFRRNWKSWSAHKSLPQLHIKFSILSLPSPFRDHLCGCGDIVFSLI